MYRVTITNDSDDGVISVTGVCDTVDWALYYAIKALGLPQLDRTMAALISYLADYELFYTKDDVFPGQQAMLNEIVGNAFDLNAAWDKYCEPKVE